VLFAVASAVGGTAVRSRCWWRPGDGQVLGEVGAQRLR